MQFGDIINAKLSKESDRPLMQKDLFAVSGLLQQYLVNHDRSIPLPINYVDLNNYSHSNALRDKKGKLTHWETLVYEDEDKVRLNDPLLKTYCLLKKQDNPGFLKNLLLDQVDFCEFGNSTPFRIQVRMIDSGFTDHYYIKLADASRIYGLELEELLSPDHTNFLYHNNTLVEEHIAGVPGDEFLKHASQLPPAPMKFIAGEFVKFNERCFARLLGDMRSYNFVVETFADKQCPYHIRAIDFDQQSFEGRKNLYMPQFYKENFDFVEMVLSQLSPGEIKNYQQEERKFLEEKTVLNRERLLVLLNSMSRDHLSDGYKITLLGKELNDHFKTTAFSACKTMGALVKCQLEQVLGEGILDSRHN